MKKLAATLAVVALLFSAGSAWADLDDGVAAYHSGDYEKAFREFLPLAEQGNTDAQNNLGVMYDGGMGVLENDAEAVKWFRKAAEQGDAYAQVNLGFMYGTGEGVPMNYVKAYMWYSLAKAQSNEDAVKGLYIIEKEMNTDQIAKAQVLATEWREKRN